MERKGGGGGRGGRKGGGAKEEGRYGIRFTLVDSVGRRLSGHPHTRTASAPVWSLASGGDKSKTLAPICKIQIHLTTKSPRVCCAKRPFVAGCE